MMIMKAWVLKGLIVKQVTIGAPAESRQKPLAMDSSRNILSIFNQEGYLEEVVVNNKKR